MAVRKATLADVELLVERRLGFVADSSGDSYKHPDRFDEQTRAWVTRDGLTVVAERR